MYAVPDFDSTSEVQPVTLRASTGGTVTLSGLTPGNYHVYTFAGDVELAYRNRDGTGGDGKSRAGDYVVARLRPAIWWWRCRDNDATSQSERRFIVLALACLCGAGAERRTAQTARRALTISPGRW